MSSTHPHGTTQSQHVRYFVYVSLFSLIQMIEIGEKCTKQARESVCKSDTQRERARERDLYSQRERETRCETRSG